jgi:methionyl-tRNA formyltransferase
VRIALLCNSLLALPAFEFLLSQNLVAGVAMPEMEHEATRRISALADAWGLPLLRIGRQDLAETLPAWLRAIEADVAFVFGFHYRLPPAVLATPRLGCFNFHPGLLPQYRGPDPIFWQIRNREPFGGVTLHRMDAEFDTGPLVHIERVAIAPPDTYGAHLNKLAFAVPRLVAALAERLTADPEALIVKPQNPAVAAYQERPVAEDLLIDWATSPATAIDALVRAANPFHGGAILFWGLVLIRIWQTSIVGAGPARPAGSAPGAVLSADAQAGLAVQCRDGEVLRLDIVATEDGIFSGGRFAAFFGLKPGDILTRRPA